MNRRLQLVSHFDQDYPLVAGVWVEATEVIDCKVTAFVEEGLKIVTENPLILGSGTFRQYLEWKFEIVPGKSSISNTVLLEAEEEKLFQMAKVPLLL